MCRPIRYSIEVWRLVFEWKQINFWWLLGVVFKNFLWRTHYSVRKAEKESLVLWLGLNFVKFRSKLNWLEKNFLHVWRYQSLNLQKKVLSNCREIPQMAKRDRRSNKILEGCQIKEMVIHCENNSAKIWQF